MFFWIVWRECLLRTFGKEGASVLPKDWQIKGKQNNQNNAERGGWNKPALSKLFWESFGLIEFWNWFVSWLLMEQLLLVRLNFGGAKKMVLFCFQINLLESTRTYFLTFLKSMSILLIAFNLRCSGPNLANNPGKNAMERVSTEQMRSSRLNDLKLYLEKKGNIQSWKGLEEPNDRIYKQFNDIYCALHEKLDTFSWKK